MPSFSRPGNGYIIRKGPLTGSPACRKGLFDRLRKFSKLRKSFENLSIENEGNP